MDFKPGDEILTTTQDYPRMLTTLRQREQRESLKLKLIKIPIPPKNLSEITAAFEQGITDRTRLILIAHQINITGQITPVKAVCDPPVRPVGIDHNGGQLSPLRIQFGITGNRARVHRRTWLNLRIKLQGIESQHFRIHPCAFSYG